MMVDVNRRIARNYDDCITICLFTHCMYAFPQTTQPRRVGNQISTSFNQL